MSLRNIKILYVEDEKFIRENMVELLEFFSANVIALEDASKAYELYRKEKPDIIIADIEMAGVSGLELVERVRKNDKNVQIIITTAYTTTEYLLKAVELNIVKYLIKPVSLNEIEKALSICKENILRVDNPLKYLSNDAYYNLRLKQLMINNNEIYLDYHEKKFIELLIKAQGSIVSYSELENTIWQNGMSTSAVRSLVFNLRKKLPKDVIVNIPKIGYKINLKA